jgi:hypothetical protein
MRVNLSPRFRFHFWVGFGRAEPPRFCEFIFICFSPTFKNFFLGPLFQKGLGWRQEVVCGPQTPRTEKVTGEALSPRTDGLRMSIL